MKIKTLIQESIEELFNDKWFSVYKLDGWYTYVHEKACNGKGVAILGYKKVDGKYMYVGRYENCPPHRKGLKLASLTGGVDKNDVIYTAVKEFKEEAGITIKAEQLIPLGIAHTYKAADTTHYLFAVDCQDLEIGKPTGDGTKGEIDAYCSWVSEEELVNSLDPLNHMLIMRLKNHETIQKTKSNKKA